MRFDRVDSVTVRANRSLCIPARKRLPVNALHEGVVDLRVALAACRRNIEFVDRRFAVVGGKNLVRAMTICTDRGLLRSLLRSASVHAFLVADEGLGALTARLHQKLLPVASATRVGNVFMIPRRLLGGGGHLCVRAAMAILASRRGRARLARNGVLAVCVSILRIRMALRAPDL